MFKKSFLPMLLCASFIASPMIAAFPVEDLNPNWSDYFTSQRFGTDMLHVSDGALYIAFTTLMASLTVLTVYGTYKLICDSENSSSQEANKPHPYYPNEVIDLQVDISINQ